MCACVLVLVRVYVCAHVHSVYVSMCICTMHVGERGGDRCYVAVRVFFVHTQHF